MTVEELCKNAELKIVSLPHPERLANGVYIGDLLSWVMGRAFEDNVWITIMSNINVIAVAALADVSCVVLADDVTLDENVLATAKEKGINVLSSSLPIFETALSLNKVLK